MKIIGETCLSAAAVAIFATGIVMALAWPVETKTFPIVMGGAGLALALAALAGDIRLWAAGTAARTADEAAVSAEESSRVRVTFAWILGFFASVFVLGFQWGLPLTTLLYYRYEARLSWVVSLVLAAATWGFLYFVATTLHLQLYDGFFMAR
jgi:hypothetical protein